jgi:hypothetical protein
VAEDGNLVALKRYFATFEIYIVQKWELEKHFGAMNSCRLCPSLSGLPDGIFSNKNPNLGKFWSDLQWYQGNWSNALWSFDVWSKSQQQCLVERHLVKQHLVE